MRTSAAVTSFAVAASLTLSVAAQQQTTISLPPLQPSAAVPAVAPQRPTHHETIEVRLLEVDAVVTDKKGAPVHGLTRDDFELLENGRPQWITNFSEFREAEQRQPSHAADPAAGVTPERPRARTVVILLDAMPLYGGETRHLFDVLRSLVERTIRDGDRLEVLGWREESGFQPIMSGSGTKAADALVAALQKHVHSGYGGPSIEKETLFFDDAAHMAQQMEARSRSLSGHVSAADVLDLSPTVGPAPITTALARAFAEQELAAMKRKTASMQRIVTSRRPLNGGKTAIIYVSNRFSHLAGNAAWIALPLTSDELAYDTAPLIEAVVRAANANGVAFYALHPHIPSTAGETLTGRDTMDFGSEAVADQLNLNDEMAALSDLTEPTGGTIGVGWNGIQQIAQKITSDLDSYYSFGWRARSDGSDRERRLVIRAKNPDYIVRTRSTFVEKSQRTRAADSVVAQLFESGTTESLDFDVEIGKSRPGKLIMLPVDVTIPADQLQFADDGNEKAARYTVLIAAGSSIADATEVRQDSQRVVLPPNVDAPTGAIHYTLDIATDGKPRKLAIGIHDDNADILGVRTIELSGSAATVLPAAADPASAAAWREAIDRADAERKPLLIFFQPKRCRGCEQFMRVSLPHPAIVRRRSSVVIATVAFSRLDESLPWPVNEPGIGFFDRTHKLRAKWVGVPDTATLGTIIDGAAAAGPHFDAADVLERAEGKYAGAVEIATGLAQLGQTSEARAALEDSIANGTPERAQLASIALILLDHAPDAMSRLQTVADDARTPRVAAEAFWAMSIIHRARGELAAARDNWRHVIDVGGADSPLGKRAAAALALGEAAPPAASTAVIRLIPPDQPVVTGRQRIRTLVMSPEVARVAFSLDQKQIGVSSQPPFTIAAHFDRDPQTHVIGVTAYDDAGAVLGHDERRINDAGDAFWVRLNEPANGWTAGTVPVTIRVHAPVSHHVEDVSLFWNDKKLTSLARAPWSASIDLPPDAKGIVRVVAHLDDGRTTEDAVPLGSGGYSERAEVQMIELPVTITDHGRAPAVLHPEDLVVEEGQTRRAVESITFPADAPATIGILIDGSSSMENTLPDVQEAAMRFLDSLLEPNDRAFVIAFDSQARLLQPATSEHAALRQAIMSITPSGLTALHDAMILGLLQFEGVKGRRALVVFTDGYDTSSRYTSNDLKAISQRVSIPVYAIRASDAPLPAPLVKSQIAYAQLRDVARASGGELHDLGSLDALGEIYSRIAESLQAQMLITIRTGAATSENEWRPLTVTPAARNLSIRAPAGYFATR